MNRREFAIGIGSGTLLIAGGGAILGDVGLADGPAYGSVAMPPNSGSITLDNGVKATLYAHGAIAFFGASLVTDSQGGTAVAGRLRNVSGNLLAEVRVRVQFLAEGDEVLREGWVVEQTLPNGADWEFVAGYSGDEPDRIAAATIATIERS